MVTNILSGIYLVSSFSNGLPLLEVLQSPASCLCCISGISPSASLASSWSVTTANRSKREGWSLQLELVSGSGSLPLQMGSDSKFSESAFPRYDCYISNTIGSL